MPRIDAPTVAEHRQRRHAAVVAAARSLLAHGGPSAVTPAAVAAQIGLGRSSVYEYFASSAELLAAAVEDAGREATERLDAAVDDSASPRDRIRSYAREAVAVAAAGHGPVDLPSATDLPQACRARLAEIHARLNEPLRRAVEDLGAPDPELAATIISAAISAAVRELEHRSAEEVTTTLLDLLDGGLTALRRGSEPSRPSAPLTGRNVTDAPIMDE